MEKLNTYVATFARTGTVKIRAASEDEARKIAYSHIKTKDIAWDDDWYLSDFQPEE